MVNCFLLLDQGNTRLKFRLIRRDGEILREGSVLNTTCNEGLPIGGIRPDFVMQVQSGPEIFRPESFWPGIETGFPGPQDADGISWAYSDLNKLGQDRMAAIMGAKGMFPKSNLVIADAGTCLTVDYLSSEGRHFGGFISPGYRMRLQAMHSFTRSLPLLNPDKSIFTEPGNSTESCMFSGAFHGITAELDYHFQTNIFGPDGADFRILTGGDAKDLAHHLKQSTFVAEDLIFRGLFQACLNRH